LSGMRKDYMELCRNNRTFLEDAEVFKVIVHPVRLRILATLSTKKCNVMNICEELGLPQSTVSHHLALLRNKRIIEGTRDKIEMHYSLVHPWRGIS